MGCGACSGETDPQSEKSSTVMSRCRYGSGEGDRVGVCVWGGVGGILHCCCSILVAVPTVTQR